MRLPLLVVAALLAGCLQGPPGPQPAPTLTDAPAAAPVFALGLRVTQEVPDGLPIAGAEVHIGLLGAAGDLVGSPMVRFADADGRVRLEWRTPVRVAVQALAPAKDNWTVEGAHVEVGEVVASDRGVVSERDLFLPLYRSTLAFTVGATWSTTVAEVGEGGTLQPVHTDVALGFPEGLQDAYLQRLTKARVALDWEDTLTQRADLAAGLAWDGVLWVEGPSSGPGLAPGPRTAAYDEPLPGLPSVDFAATRLQAAAVSRTAIVGDVPLAFTVDLGFGGARPSELPDPTCHLRATACAPVPPVAA